MEVTADARLPRQDTRTFFWIRAAGHLGRIALGLIFLAAGFLKALDPAEFSHQIAGYGLIGPRLSAVAAPALIVFEIVLGVALVAGVRPRLTGSASILLLLLFIGIEAYGIAAGRTEACGCFGAYLAQPLRWWVLIEDAYMLVLAWYAAAAAGLPIPAPALRLRRTREAI